MTEREHHAEPVIELGQASVETKGQAIFDNDASSGKLNYVSGIAED